MRLVATAGAVLAVALAVSGCGLSSITSGIGGGIFGGSEKKSADIARVNEEQLLSAAKSDTAASVGSTSSDIAHGCPRMVASSRDSHLTIYEPGKAGDGLAVMHRGEIMKTARECQIEPGRVTVKYGFSGRVLLGPRGRAGPISLPVTIAVTDAKRARIAGDAARVDVVVAADKPIGYFSVVKTVTFIIPEGTRPGEFEVQVGFDRSAPGAG